MISETPSGTNYLTQQRDYFEDRLILTIILGALLFGFIFGISIASDNIWLSNTILLPLLGIALLIMGYYGKKYRNYRKGIKGEDRVFAELEFVLPNEYHCIRNKYINKQDVDIIVWGPTGIFAIEVKNYDGKLSYDGAHLLYKDKPLKGRDPLKQASRSALEVRNLLKSLNISWVEAILALPGSVKIVNTETNKVAICPSHTIASYILSRPNILSEEIIIKISELLS